MQQSSIYAVQTVIVLFILITGLNTCELYGQEEPFVTLWDTTKPSSGIKIDGEKQKSTDTQIYFPGIGTDYTIEWQEQDNLDHSGTLTSVTSTQDNPILIDFATSGKYIVKVFPKGFTQIRFDVFGKTKGDKQKIEEIQQWGNIAWESMEYAFYKCSNLQLTAEDIPDLQLVTNMNATFGDCVLFNADLNNWDVSQVETMNRLFDGCEKFNQNLNNWDVSNVTNMGSMFKGCEVFNGNISSWNVGKVTTMNSMFSFCAVFNGKLNSWDVSQVTDTNGMFYSCTVFNDDLGDWDISNIKDMSMMFCNCSSFNGNISVWDTSHVARMNAILQGCSTFNQSLGNWTLESLIKAGGCSLINIFSNSGMSCVNYSATLQGWVDNPKTPSDRRFMAEDITYGEVGKIARQNLIEHKGWNLQGDVYDADCSETATINEQDVTSSLEVYPNPVNEIINIDLRKMCNVKKLTVTDQNARTVLTQLVPNQDILQLDVSKLSPGVYTISVGGITKKIIKN